MTQAHYVFCLWEFAPTNEKKRLSVWRLEKSFPADMDGHPIFSGDSYRDWLYKESDDDGDDEPIPGRLVTMWSMAGVELYDFHPSTSVKWLSPYLTEKLKKENRWQDFFEDGGTLFFGTIAAAEKYFVPVDLDVKKP